MALIVKQNIIKEDLLDENGNKLGELKFNPNDARIMSKLTKIVNELGDILTKIKSMDKIQPIQKNIESIEDYEEISETFKFISNGFTLEEDAVDSVLNNLSEVFGKETIDIFTGGTKDVLSVMPLIDFILPYVKKARESKINKYISKNCHIITLIYIVTIFFYLIL